MITNSDISFLMDNRIRNNQLSIKMSIESRKSNLSSCRSLERPSWVDRHSSLSKKHSMIEVMSLQSNRKSDLYDKLIEEVKPLQKQSLGGLGLGTGTYDYLPYEQNFEIKNDIPQRKSQQESQNITHTCKCYTDCEWQSCECLIAKKQLCLPGYCCQVCIEKKNALLQGITEQVQSENKIFCTCKKTKCKKKYCTCFAAGIMCGELCSCEGCTNCPKVSEGMDVEEEEDPITEEQLARMQMPQRMEFQPFQFGRISN